MNPVPNESTGVPGGFGSVASGIVTVVPLPSGSLGGGGLWSRSRTSRFEAGSLMLNPLATPIPNAAAAEAAELISASSTGVLDRVKLGAGAREWECEKADENPPAVEGLS